MSENTSQQIDDDFPSCITSLPEVDINFQGVRGWLAQGEGTQIVFFDIAPSGDVPPHAHGEQWGIVVNGELEFTIAGETRTYRKGDSYYIPAGVIHSARFPVHCQVIDFFPDPDRHKAK
ncbi:MAG: cupin domain-containing protein [Pyrinomonadaceae bacterium]